MFVPKYPPTAAGGLERQAHLLSRELVRRGCSVYVLALDGLPGSVSAHDAFEGVCVTRLATHMIVDQAVALGSWLTRFAPHFDVCHVHGMSSVSVLVANVCGVRGVPTLLKLPNVGDAGIPGMLRRRFGRVWRAGFVLADAVVAMTSESLGELESLRYPASRVFCTSNGVSIPAQARNHLGVKNPPVFLFTGRLERTKGVHDLIEAWRIVQPRLESGSRLRIVGSGPLGPALRAAIDSYGLVGSVEMLDWIGNIGPEYMKADVCVLPSYFEGNSNTVLESMSAGLPVASTRVGGTEMLVGLEGAPYLCESGDVVALAAILEHLGNDRQLRSKVGAAMRERAARRFDIASVATGYLTAYEALSQGRRDDVRACSPVSFEAA